MAEYLFWCALIILIHTYFGYLLLSVVLGKLFGRPVDKKQIFPTVSLIVSAFNEQNVIRQKIENSLALDYPQEKLEIVIASESNDQTNNIAESYLKTGITLYAYQTHQGKSKTLYNTVPKTKGEIIVFSDANAILAQDALKKLVRNFSEPQIGAVLGKLIISNPEDSTTAEGESLYKRYEGLLRKYNSYLRSVIGADGSIFAIRRELYLPLSPARGDDFELVLRILIKRFGVVFEPEAISYEQASVDYRAEIKRKIRIVSWLLRSSLLLLKEMLWPLRGVLILRLFSNKILRWLSPYFLILLFFCSLTLANTHFFYKLFSGLQIAFYTLAIISGFCLQKTQGRLMRLLRMPFYFVTFNYAFLLGTWRGLFCRQTSIWEKVR